MLTSNDQAQEGWQSPEVLHDYALLRECLQEAWKVASAVQFDGGERWPQQLEAVVIGRSGALTIFPLWAAIIARNY